MASQQALQRVQQAVWVLIYGGLIAVLAAQIVRTARPGWLWPLTLLGLLGVAIGVALIVWRARRTPRH